MSDPLLDRKDDELARRGYPETCKRAHVEKLLGVSRETVYDLVESGELEAFRLKKHLRFERRSLAHYLRVSRVR